MSSGRACCNSQRVLREFHQEAFQYYNQMMERYESFASKESRKRFLFIPDLSKFKFCPTNFINDIEVDCLMTFFLSLYSITAPVSIE
mmetsp:Transcript_17700/g.35435  ORF Transcript_17700/g.35435 Transcript_17700/m.35435 type:complete len:87 (+) Transcript_17700:2206-2466(+)